MRRIGSRQLTIAIAALLVVGCTAPRSPAGSSVVPSSTDASSPAATQAASLPPETPTPTPTEVPPDVVFVPPSDSYVAGLIYSCGGADFPIEVLEGPATADDSSDPPAQQLNEVLDLQPIERWWLVRREQELAVYVGEITPDNYWYGIFEVHNGAWRVRGYGDCQMAAAVEDGVVDTWWIPAARWPSPADDTLQVTIRDECPDTVADRMLEPIVRYGENAILVILSVTPQEPRDSRCRSGDDEEQLARVSVQLDEPVGDRALLDGHRWPPRDAHIRSDELLWCCG